MLCSACYILSHSITFLQFYYPFRILFFFFFPSVSVLINRVLKKRKKCGCSSSGKGLVIVTCLSNAIPRPSTFVCPLSSKSTWALIFINQSRVRVQTSPTRNAYSPSPRHRPGFYITMLNMCKISGQWDSLFDEVSRRVKQVAWNVFEGRENATKQQW